MRWRKPGKAVIDKCEIGDSSQGVEAGEEINITVFSLMQAGGFWSESVWRGERSGVNVGKRAPGWLVEDRREL